MKLVRPYQFQNQCISRVFSIATKKEMDCLHRYFNKMCVYYGRVELNNGILHPSQDFL